MTPETILAHYDSGQLWNHAPSADERFDVPAAYQIALAVRSLRVTRGEVPRGFKIGFTNRNIWSRYQVYAPIWGVVYDSTLSLCDGPASLSIADICQPRIEPEAVFGMKSTPPANATLNDLFDALDWVAPGFEIVQSHLPDWKFEAADTVADGGLHARLLVGRKVPVRDIASHASELNDLLAATRVTLMQGDQIIDQGCGANVLDSPLHALHHFLAELRLCPGAPDLGPGDVITTGTWTDAWPVVAGERWTGIFSAPLSMRFQIDTTSGAKPQTVL
jgi:2-oxo-3-hexenedioate decarboxylase